MVISDSSSVINEVDERYIRLAIEQARIAEENGDVPIGVIIR
jgi:tRNA(Arg) A34 adenosine deaminase TadA